MPLYWIDINYACFGIITKNKIVKETAPIGKWMKGKHIKYIRQWVDKKDGETKRIRRKK
jgi:hypothetical protein